MSNILYSDLDLDFSIATDKDIKREVDRDAIKQALRLLLNTTPGERVMRPDYGCFLREYLFHPMDEITSQQIGEEILEAIELFEPRIDVQQIIVTNDPDNGQYDIEILYRIVTTQMVDSLNLALRKI